MPNCPRTGTIIKTHCNIEECPFYSELVTYYCLLLHQEVFFPDYPIPQSAIELASQLNKNEYQKILQISVYTLRLYIILSYYQGFDYESINPYFKEVYLESNSTNRVLKFQGEWLRKIGETKIDIDFSSYTCFLNSTKGRPVYKIMRAIIPTIKKEVSLIDIPLEFVFKCGTKLFYDKPWKMAENLGLVEKQFETAQEIFRVT